MSQPLSLEILIKTILDNRGLAATQSEVKQLSATFQEAAGKGANVETSVDGVVNALQRQRKAAAESKTAWENLTDAQRQEQREAAQTAVRMLQSEEAQKRAADASRQLGKELGVLKLAGQGVNNVFAGLNQGGIGGLIQAGRGFVDITRAMTSGVAQVGRGLAAGGAAAAPMIVAIQAMNKLAAENRAEMDKWWTELKTSSTETAAAIEANSLRVQKALKDELAAVTQLAAAYEESQGRTDSAYARDAKLNPARRDLRDQQLSQQETAALAKARSPAEREKIQRDFAQQRRLNGIKDTTSDFTSADAQADVTIDKAGGAIAEANARAREQQQAVDEAQRGYDIALQRTRAYEPTDNSLAAQRARDSARVAKDNLDKVRAKADEVNGEAGKVIASAQAEIDAANLVKEETALRKQAYQAMIALSAKAVGGQAGRDMVAASKAGDSTGTRQGDPAAGPSSSIAGEITTSDGRKITVKPSANSNSPGRPGSGGTITRGGESIQVDSAGTVEQLKKTGEVLGKVFKEVEYFGRSVSADATKLQRRLESTKESRAGG